MRRAWVDAAKGLAILLVVFGHSWRGIDARGLVPKDLFFAVDARIYAFHMPVFFALSGLFVARSLARSTIGDFVTSRITRLIWPMVLWTYLFLAAKLVAGSLANAPVQISDLFILPIPGQLHFWFLWALFLQQMALIATRPILAPEGRYPTAVLAGLAGLSIVFALMPLPESVSHWAGHAFRHAPFLVLGIVIGQTAPFDRMGWATRLAALAVFALCLTAWPVFAHSKPLMLLGSLVLTATFLAVLSGLSPGWLVSLGLASMAIYVSHTIFAAFLREILLAVGIRDIWLQMAAGTAIGIIGPLILLAIARRLKLTRILGF